MTKINVVKDNGAIEEYYPGRLQGSIARANARVREDLRISDFGIIEIEKEIAADAVSDYGGEVKKEDLRLLVKLALARHSFYTVAIVYELQCLRRQDARTGSA